MEGEGKGRSIGRKIFKVSIGSRKKDTGLSNKRGITAREVKRESGKERKFEERLEKGRGSDIARKYLEEMKERWKRGRVVTKWKEEREEFFRSRGLEEGVE